MPCSGGVLCTLHENVKVRLATMEKEEENRTEYSLGVFFSLHPHILPKDWAFYCCKELFLIPLCCNSFSNCELIAMEDDYWRIDECINRLV